MNLTPITSTVILCLLVIKGNDISNKLTNLYVSKFSQNNKTKQVEIKDKIFLIINILIILSVISIFLYAVTKVKV